MRAVIGSIEQCNSNSAGMDAAAALCRRDALDAVHADFVFEAWRKARGADRDRGGCFIHLVQSTSCSELTRIDGGDFGGE